MENLGSIFFYHLDKAIKAYRQYAQIKLRENGFEITVDQWLVLKSVAENRDINQNELSEMVFKDKASVTRIIDVLVLYKYMSRELHPDSKRSNQLTVTRKGIKLLSDIRPFILKNRKHALKNISIDEIKTTERVLKIIAENCKKNNSN
jgi:MarR family transcriptional regulator for hemolysin